MKSYDISALNDESNVVRCPVCGYECSHIDSIDRNCSDIADNSYGNAVITFHGECGHRWKVVFRDYKGHVVYAILAQSDEFYPAEKYAEAVTIREVPAHESTEHSY